MDRWMDGGEQQIFATNPIFFSFAAEIWQLDEATWSLKVLQSIACNSVSGIGQIYDSGLLLTIPSGHHLGRADTFGQSDPFCKVFWLGCEIGKTGVCDNTCDPV